MSRVLSKYLAAALALAGLAGARADEPPLRAYNADIAQTSISGVSSGAFMAVQFATAWSSIVIGVGAVAGGPFGCSEGSAAAALSTCMGGRPAVDLGALIRHTDTWSGSGAIDDTANIARQRIYLFSGYNDSVVARSVNDALRAFYTHYRAGSLFYQTAIGAGHALVTTAHGGGCADNGGEYINRCGYDQAGIILQHIYGALTPRAEGATSGHLVAFPQAEFTGARRPIDDSLDDRGFAFVPAPCEARAPCRVHVVLHGCLQSYRDIDEEFVRRAGYNEWADTNQIIILYPQIRAVGGVNPQSCWDWWGYLDADPIQSPSYLLKTGRQIGVIKAMIDRITGGAVASPAQSAAALAPPATVAAVDASDSAIDLAWTSVPSATSYEVFRAAPTDRDFRRIASAEGLSLGDAGLQPATAYRYMVRAAFSGAKSAFSPVVSGKTKRMAPRCLEPGTCAVR